MFVFLDSSGMHRILGSDTNIQDNSFDIFSFSLRSLFHRNAFRRSEKFASEVVIPVNLLKIKDMHFSKDVYLIQFVFKIESGSVLEKYSHIK
jgi:hypothetical protein